MRRVSVVLVSPNNSGNVGAVARVMANFGFSRLIIVDPRCKIDEEARNRAKHAQTILDKIKYMSFSEVLESHDVCVATTGIRCTDYNVVRSPIVLKDAVPKINSLKGSVALIFGREDSGLSNDELRLADFVVTIPTSDKYSILNLSQSVGIVLYALASETFKPEIDKIHKQASKREKDELLSQINRIIAFTKFRTPDEKKTQELVWKKVIGKSTPTKREAFAIIGFLKKIKK